ncbi:MAG TPA: glycosyltransferase [Pyrinomonadaceae bacterium]|nr:glycosyltransferase [Pyrinomonadaceae bacterium]
MTDTSLKILQISSAQSIGGGERHFADLASGLATRGHDVHAVLRCDSPLLSELPELGINISTLPLRNALDAPSARKLARLVRQREIDIVHAHMARDYPLAAYATRRNPQAKLIVTRHVLFPLNRLHRLVLSQAARVIAVSEAVARAIRAQGLVPAKQVVVVPNGIDVDRLAPARARFDARTFHRRWNIPEDRLLVGSVGEIRPLKGHEDFLRAAAVIIRHFPKTHFLIAGIDASHTGENRAALERLIADLSLTKHVQLFGWLDDLPSFYGALDVFVSASHTESFGLAIAEALASGTPVVATRTEGAEEILAPEQSGSLVPVSDVEALATAVTAILKHPEQSRRRAMIGTEIARRRFSVARMVEETEQLYRTALEEF